MYNFLYDLVVNSEDYATHLLHLRDVFSRVRQAGLTVGQPSKIFLGITVPKYSLINDLLYAQCVPGQSRFGITMQACARRICVLL